MRPKRGEVLDFGLAKTSESLVQQRRPTRRPGSSDNELGHHPGRSNTWPEQAGQREDPAMTFLRAGGVYGGHGKGRFAGAAVKSHHRSCRRSLRIETLQTVRTGLDRLVCSAREGSEDDGRRPGSRDEPVISTNSDALPGIDPWPHAAGARGVGRRGNIRAGALAFGYIRCSAAATARGPRCTYATVRIKRAVEIERITTAWQSTGRSLY